MQIPKPVDIIHMLFFPNCFFTYGLPVNRRLMNVNLLNLSGVEQDVYSLLSSLPIAKHLQCEGVAVSS